MSVHLEVLQSAALIKWKIRVRVAVGLSANDVGHLLVITPANAFCMLWKSGWGEHHEEKGIQRVLSLGHERIVWLLRTPEKRTWATSEASGICLGPGKHLWSHGSIRDKRQQHLIHIQFYIYRKHANSKRHRTWFTASCRALQLVKLAFSLGMSLILTILTEKRCNLFTKTTCLCHSFMVPSPSIISNVWFKHLFNPPML